MLWFSVLRPCVVFQADVLVKNAVFNFRVEVFNSEEGRAYFT
jgi:hypothetical protein